MGIAGAGALSLSALGCRESAAADSSPAVAPKAVASVTPSKGFPAPRHPDFNPGWTLSDEEATATYNNFYEFTLGKDAFAFWNAAMQYVVEPGEFQIMAGPNSVDLKTAVLTVVPTGE